MGFPLWGRGRAFAGAKVPEGKCPFGSAGWTATGSPSPQQPPVVVASNPATLMHNKKPHTLAGTGLFVVQGWTMGFEPTTTGTTIRGSTAELRSPSSLAPKCGGIIHGIEEECKLIFDKNASFFCEGRARSGAWSGKCCNISVFCLGGGQWHYRCRPGGCR